jgi:hypothetical protein
MTGVLHVSASTQPSSGGLQQQNTIMADSVKDGTSGVKNMFPVKIAKTI